MINVIVSILLSLSYCLFVTIADRNLANIITTYISLNSTYYIIAFMILCILCGAFSAFIISRYKNFNFIASMILPTLLILFNLYILLSVTIEFYFEENEGSFFSLIDWGLIELWVISIVVLFLSLRSQSN